MLSRLKISGSKLAITIYAYAVCILAILGFSNVYELFHDHKLIVGQGPLGPELSDFGTFYAAGLIARENYHQHVDIYDVNEQLLAQNKTATPSKVEHCSYVPYPPYFFTLMSSFATLPPDLAWLIYCALGFVAIIVSLAVLPTIFIAETATRVAITALTIASAACWVSTRSGDTSLYLVPSLTLFWFFLKEKKYFFAALSSFMALIKIQYFPFVFIAGALVGGRSFVGGVALSGMALLAAAWANLGTENILSFPKAIEIVESGKVIGSNPHLFQTLRGTLYLWAGQDTHANHVLTAIALPLSFIFCAWLWKFWYVKVKESEPYAFEISAALTLLCCLFFSLHTYAIDYMVLGTIATLLWKWTGTSADSPKKVVRLVLLLAPALSWVFSIFQRPIVSTIHFQPYALLALVMIVALVVSVRQTCILKEMKP